MTTLDKILKARSILILDHPFFGSLALRLGLVEEDKCVSTAVDGINMFYNPKYIDSLTIKEVVGVVAHEVMHMALGHVWRRGSREYRGWNVATDYTINGNLITTGFTLPKGVLTNPAYNSLSAEEIYTRLPKSKNTKPRQGGKGGKGKSNSKTAKADKGGTIGDPGMCGAVLPAKSPQEAKELKAEWQAAVSQAVRIAKGELPSDLKRQIQEVLNPVVPWYILLRDFVEKSARNDYDWTRPSRRYIGRDVILPSLVSEALPEVAIAIDTSGSINAKALQQFATEASNVLGVYDTTIRVIYCDSKVHKEEIFTRADLPMKLNPVGGGGTNFCPVFKYIKEQNITPACLIYFTDLYGAFPAKEAGYPTMWLTMTEDKKAPFGITVPFKN